MTTESTKTASNVNLDDSNPLHLSADSVDIDSKTQEKNDNLGFNWESNPYLRTFASGKSYAYLIILIFKATEKPDFLGLVNGFT